MATREGVRQDPATQTWSWICTCGMTETNLRSRTEARQAYKEHRMGECSMHNSTRVKETVPMVDTKVAAVPKAAKTVAKKKAAKKKAVKKTAKKKAVKKTAKKGEAKVKLQRIGFVENPKTKRTVMLNVTKDGGVFPGQRERFGVAKVDRWAEVRAASHSEAVAALKAGGGEWFGPGKKKKMGK